MHLPPWRPGVIRTQRKERSSTPPWRHTGANLKLITHRCYLREVAFEWELTEETLYLPLGFLQGGCINAFPAAQRAGRAELQRRSPRGLAVQSPLPNPAKPQTMSESFVPSQTLPSATCPQSINASVQLAVPTKLFSGSSLPHTNHSETCKTEPQQLNADS